MNDANRFSVADYEVLIDEVQRVAYGDISQTASAKLAVAAAGESLTRFPLPWSHHARLMAVRNAQAGASERLALAKASK
jgi:hypothetical protein